MNKLTDFFKKLTYNIGVKMLKFSLKNNNVKTHKNDIEQSSNEFNWLTKPITNEFIKLNDFDTNYIIFNKIITKTNPSNLQLVIEYNNYMTMGYILTDEEIKFEDENDETLETVIYTQNIKHGTKSMSKVYNLSDYSMYINGDAFVVDISEININPIDKVKCMVNVKLIDITDNLGVSTIYYNLV